VVAALLPGGDLPVGVLVLAGAAAGTASAIKLAKLGSSTLVLQSWPMNCMSQWHCWPLQKPLLQAPHSSPGHTTALLGHLKEPDRKWEGRALARLTTAPAGHRRGCQQNVPVLRKPLKAAKQAQAGYSESH
jgi:hypothetical protein